MKKIHSFFKEHKLLSIGLMLLVTVVLFIVGKESGHDHATTIANVGAVVTLTEAEKAGFSEGEQNVILAVKKLTVQLKEQVDKGKIDKTQLDAALSGIKTELTGGEIKNLQEELKALEDIAKTQGTTLAALQTKLSTNEASGFKSIAQILKEDEAELRKLKSQGNGIKHYMVTINHKGEPVMKPFDPNKASSTHATVDDVPSGNTASVASALSTATILRLAADAPIVSQYRNTPWVFDLCNLVNAGYENQLAIWWEENAKTGSSDTVLEGGTKPKTQYSYTRKASDYKKEATLLSFSDEFSLDFAQLQSDIMGKGRTDLINRINTTVLTNIIAAATAYNTAASFGSVANANDFDVLAAMAAQVDNATFGAMANSAVMSTFKKYKMGIIKSNQGEYLDRPSVLDNLAFVGNPAMGADDVLVGDLKQYNIMLRGGLIVRVGYNGTDFAENKFSVVMEQYYFDYISNIRKAAIVKGQDFATVKTALQPA